MRRSGQRKLRVWFSFCLSLEGDVGGPCCPCIENGVVIGTPKVMGNPQCGSLNKIMSHYFIEMFTCLPLANIIVGLHLAITQQTEFTEPHSVSGTLGSSCSPLREIGVPDGFRASFGDNSRRALNLFSKYISYLLLNNDPLQNEGLKQQQSSVFLMNIQFG